MTCKLKRSIERIIITFKNFLSHEIWGSFFYILSSHEEKSVLSISENRALNQSFSYIRLEIKKRWGNDLYETDRNAEKLAEI